jgi:PadR family transcriptional regulator PadR
MTANVIGVLLSLRCRWPVGPGRWNVRARIERFVEPAILLLLAAGPRHGYDLKEQLMTLAGGDGADAANLYRLLRQLELEGIVRSSWDTSGSGPARRVYRLTVVGRRLLDEWANELRRLEGTTQAFLATYDAMPPPRKRGAEHA